MKITNVVLSAGLTGFYSDDQQAIRAGVKHDGFIYVGAPETKGFTAIRQVGESVSVMLVLEDGQIAYGDCVTVQYPVAGGRDPLLSSNEMIAIIEKEVIPKLRNRKITTFKQMAEEIDQMHINGTRLHTAIRYGVTQAILEAAAKVNKKTMVEVIIDEYETGITLDKIPIYTQSGDDRYSNVDKMILKRADVLPHGLINNVEEKLGLHGELLKDYVSWLKKRIMGLRTSESYSPVLHIDVYGTIGLAFNQDVDRMAGYIGELEQLASPFKLRIESPMDAEDRDKQWQALKSLRMKLKEKGIAVELVADEWCNTLEDIKLFADEAAVDMIQIKTPDLGGINNVIEAILYCKRRGVGAFSGGSCNETEKSAQICTHIAMACGADQCLAKPGMGVDEGMMIVHNEMNRILALKNIHRTF